MRARPKAGSPVCSEFLTRSERQTRELGARLAAQLPVPCVVLLRGPLGVGKTTLAKGMAEGFGFSDPAGVSSPSFTLVNIYPGRIPIYHVDLYRASRAKDLRSIGLDDFIGREGVTIVEWSEHLLFPVESAVVVELEDAEDDCRRIRVLRRATSAVGSCGSVRKRRSGAGKPEERHRRVRR